MTALKDERLAELASRLNVARFASFSPGDPRLRFSVLGMESNVDGGTLEETVRQLLDQVGSVNVRTFLDAESKSTDFIYGLTSADDVEATVRKYATNGFFTIINETVDVNDGGVSGVSVGGVVEFAPGTTPRGVEKAGNFVARMSTEIAQGLLEQVYRFPVEFPPTSVNRVEFSLHPQKVGHRHDHILYWEVQTVRESSLTVTPLWPNEFSRFLGDKTFGLLMAHTYGLPVPLTTVIARHVAPFSFGTQTNSGEVWLRTSPSTPDPGRFSTQRGWADPFVLLTKEDPNGVISSVLSQASVDAIFSGAAISQPSKIPLIEGVRGFGDDFMLGEAPILLPPNVIDDVENLVKRAELHFGRVDLEWAHDGEKAWIIQLHTRAIGHLSPGTLSPGSAETWLTFNPADGLEELRQLISKAKTLSAGIEVLGAVGVTSHIGDILRAAGVPGRLSV